MSLDVYLYQELVVKATGDEKLEQVYSQNITHNLGRMAEALGCYEACWRPEEIGIQKAEEIIPYLETALDKLNKNRQDYVRFEAKNGWGMIDHFKDFLTSYLDACRRYPHAFVEACR